MFPKPLPAQVAQPGRAGALDSCHLWRIGPKIRLVGLVFSAGSPLDWR